MTALARIDCDIQRYMNEAECYPLLSREEEFELAVRYREQGDIAAAHRLVVSNLRFVVRIAMGYRGYGMKLLELVQEGNIGLMQAVKKFDPHRGYRLITYAVWWIRAQIHAFILRSWSLVKIGAGNNGRKLFFNLRKESSRAEQQYFGDVDVDALAERLGVATSEWNAMAARMALRDFSLDCPIGDDDGTTHLERLCDDDVPSAETALVNRQEHKLLASAVAETRRTLNEKESVILDERLLADEPKTMAELGESLGISRQRVQQIEVKILDKLRQAWNAPAT